MLMKIALFSDVHGNSIALDGVLRDIAAHGGVDAYWVLGDLAAIGPDPIGVLERLVALPHVKFVRGNTDRYVAFGDRPGPTLEEAVADPQLLPFLVEVANTFAWTQGMLTASGWLGWLKDLPLELELTLPDGTGLLGVHASPGRDDGAGIVPENTDDEIRQLWNGCNASLVCVGHTHLPWERRWENRHIVNLGAVSLSLTQDKQSSYVLLEADKDGYRVQYRSVAYDRAAVIEQLKAIGHPARGYLIRHLCDPGE